MNQTIKSLHTPDKLKEAMPFGYSRILEDLTPYTFQTLSKVIGQMNDRHRTWPVIMALAQGGEVAARKVAAELGWIRQAA